MNELQIYFGLAFIFQVSGTITVASGVKITLVGGVLTQNIVWASVGAVNIGSTAHFEGILLASTAVTLDTGATMNGRILSQTSVALQQATVNSLA